MMSLKKIDYFGVMIMFGMCDTVRIKVTGEKAEIIEIDDNNGTCPPIYLCELCEKPDNAGLTDVVKWFEAEEIESA